MERLEQCLANRVKEAALRSMRQIDSRRPARIVENGRELIDFSSNDYLGLSNHPALIEAAKNALDRWGAGSGASRLMSGSLAPHHQLEAEIARFEKKEDALVFNSGYQANVSIIAALANRGDAVFADRFCHASQIDGALLSGAKMYRYEHNDPESLARQLGRYRDGSREALILTESVFSMDGDIAPLEEIVKLAKASNCAILVDEAHASGAFGHGIVHNLGLSADVDVVMGTFSKAFGGFGAFAACSSLMKRYFVNFARGFIYSTSLPASVIASNSAALKIIDEHPELSEGLQNRAAYFRDRLQKQGWRTTGASQIAPVIAGESEKAQVLSARLEEAGIRALAARPPAVPNGAARLRFSITAAHTMEDLDFTIEAMNELRSV